MMNNTGLRRIPPDQSSGSVHTFGTPRHPGITDPILSKRVCFYKSGDPQFHGLRMVINNRTFKTFDALLDSLSKKVPLPFGVRNITTPRGVHAIYTLDELEDGKSYICSDSRKIKPINLAIARKKLPPWYHARPVSSRRHIVQQARFFPGRSIHRQEPMMVRIPKRLLVFRNGDPGVKHSITLHKRTTPTFESVLEYISELVQFHVVKLYTLDGRRVDGLPGFILCSGIVVAAGREPFRPANYNEQVSLASTRLPPKRMGFRRLKALNRKKKLLSNLSNVRNFSPSSEQYIVNRIHSIAEGSRNLSSNPTNSDELESMHKLESVAETEGDTRLSDGAEGLDCLLPTEDDIEKSFRVNQDGSMTVEMRVRLTIKEEETIHWTTTLKRSSVANQLNEPCLPVPEAELESFPPDTLDLQSPAASTDTSKDKTKDNNDEDPPSLSNEIFSDSSNEDDHVKVQTDAGYPRRAPTPGHMNVKKQQTSVENIKSVTAEGLEEGMVGSYSYREDKENGAMTEKYCMVKQSTIKPVPKPRRLGSVDAHTMNSRNVSTFKSAEILQIESSGEEITETVLHLYEQQTCQDNFLANICAQGVSDSGFPFDRFATSETGHVSSKTEFQPELKRPKTAAGSIGNWRAESTSSDFTLPSLKSGAIQAANRQQKLPESIRGNYTSKQKEGNKYKRVSSKPKVVYKRVGHLRSPGKRQKEKRIKVKTFSSTGFLKRIYGNKSKSAKRTRKLKKIPMQRVDGGVATKSSQPLGDRIKSILKAPNMSQEENRSETSSVETSRLNVSSAEVSHPKRILTRQTSMHQEKQNENELLPGFNSCPVTDEYVQKWLEKSHLNPDEVSRKSETVTYVQLKSRNNGGLVTVAEEVKRLGEKSEILTSQNLKSVPVPESLLESSVKLRVQTFENKSSQLMEKTTAAQQNVHSHADGTNTKNCTGVAQKNTEELKPISNGIGSAEMKSSPIKISLQEETLPSTSSLDIPLPPPSAENTELSNSELSNCRKDASPVLSSPLYKLSSVSSHTADNRPLSMSPTSGKTESPTEHMMEMTASVQTDVPSTLREASLPRTSSIKRAPLVSNLSLERKMSLRKACLDKYTLCSDVTSETSTSTTPINIMGNNVLSNGNSSIVPEHPSNILQEDTQKLILNVMSSPPCCTSASPTSLTSDERMSSTSISSNEALTRGKHLFKETKAPQSIRKEPSSPQTSVKHVKLMSSPSTGRKPQTRELPSDLTNTSPKSSLHNYTPDKTMSPNIGIWKRNMTNASPSTEKKIARKAKFQKRQSPYSQSLDMVSPPVRNKSVREMSRNLSSENASDAANKTHRKPSTQRKHNHTPQSTNQSTKATTELDNTPTCETDTLKAGHIDQTKAKVTEDFTSAAQEMPLTCTQPLNTANQANMKPVLDKICYSIKSIKQITQNKHPSCLEKSNSLPDFSSHVASTFGSSSKALLAFLSVMTLKECLTNFNMDEVNASNVSCAEALKMIDSLREIASIEDSHKLKCSLSDLQQSASKQLLQSWKGFQELSDKCKSRSSTPNYLEHGLITEASVKNDYRIEENVINELMDNLDLPDSLKEELVSFSVEVKSESDEEKKMSARIIKKLSPNDNSSNGKITHSSKDTVPIRDATQDETANVDARSIIKKFVEINQPEESSVREDREAMHLCSTAVKEDNQHQGYTEDKSNKGRAKSGEENLEKLSCSLETEKQNMEYRKLQTHSEESMSIPNSEPNNNDDSSLDEEGQDMSSVKDVGRQSCYESASSSDAGKQHSSEELKFGCEDINQSIKSSEGDLSNRESNSEEENNQPSSNYYVELNFNRKETISNPDSNDMSNSPSLFSPEKQQENQISCIGLNGSVDESTADSDVDEQCSAEKEQLDVEHKELKVTTEESLSVLEEEQESAEVEEPLYDLSAHEAEMKSCQKFQDLFGRTEEGKVSQHDGTKSPNIVGGGLSILIETQTLHIKNDNSSLIKSDSLSKFNFNADEDSGNDHSSWEEQAEVEQTKTKDEQISSSTEEELSYYEKESSSEEEHAKAHLSTEESHEEAPLMATQSNITKWDQADKISRSVAERISLLEKQVADAQGRKSVRETSAVRRLSQRNAHLQTDVEDSPSASPTSRSTLCTRSAPQSSLAFSYDSSAVITTEHEGNRVRSIREMFLAKNVTDIQPRNRPFPSPNQSELSALRAQTSASGGYQSQTSSDVSSGEDDSARKSITKGFVRRTIERLYGKKNANPNEEPGERPLSKPKEKKKGHSSIFSPFHTARSKAMSELSYFSSTNALDTLSEATRCIAFNAQVGPGESLPMDSGRWLLRENTQIRKSVSDPVGINKSFTTSQREGMCEDTDDNTLYSLFSTKSEQEDKKSLSRKCTYFSLPHASESDACQDDQSTVSKSSVNGDGIADTKDNPEDTEMCAETKTVLPSLSDFKMTDNKVHPLAEVQSDAEVVVVQPGKGHGVMNRRLQEPDVLDLMYNFCGQHCPIL